jgi:hypothetical protein
MGQKQVKNIKRIVNRQTNRIKRAGMEQLVDYMEGLSLIGRLKLCVNILRKNLKGKENK